MKHTIWEFKLVNMRMTSLATTCINYLKIKEKQIRVSMSNVYKINKHVFQFVLVLIYIITIRIIVAVTTV